ncbi:pentatricopeptide repeat protein [Grosmannia clavigera kw1407]|uniref:Pentatricopeptide repeat protein n=1 Tax=Grosmannia clavigera (strain kw1407 / UAMH 11150) TaxID=655863 RepID=F0XGZ8_GROCL|nr:pentatricopeptide repeat protein [Grosmannia clavigera kw1407]EFX03252.1 pentatricopeptide repeat protein [Grosmannia clavigera kw1407]
MRESRAICLACRVRLSSQAAHAAVAAAAATTLRGPWHTAVGRGRAASFSAAPRKRRPRQLDDGALAVFRDVVEKQEGQQPPAGRSLAGGTELYQQLVKLTQLQSEPAVTIAELYAFFDSQMYPLMAEAPRDLPNIFKQAARKLVHEVSAARQRDYRTGDLPSVARITQVRRQLDLLNMPELWVPLVLGLVEEVLSTRQDEELAGSRAVRLDDLVQAWRIFSLPDMVVADEEALGQEAADSFRLPTPDAMLLARYARQRNLKLGLAGLFPRYAPRSLKPVVPAVLATYALLTDPDVVGGVAEAEVKTRAHEFLEAIEAILAAVPVDRAAVADMFVARPDLGAYVLGRWPLSETSRESDSSSSSSSSNKQQLGPMPRPRGRSSSLDAVHGQLSQALRARNLGACEAAWDVFWSSVTVPDADGADRLRQSAELFDYFIMAFATMRQPDRAIGIWNLMALAGVTPTLRTWTSFMEGCKRASNPTGIRNIWDKLVASGMPMDTAVWTARISGLIQAGEAEAGIRALEEMQELWEAANADTKTKTKTTAVKPTIGPVNAAIVGLLRRGDLGAARQILGWAGRHGIAPDLITFNTILRPLVREGRGDEVAGLLEMMARLGMQPDEATVTVLLEGALGGGGGGGGRRGQRGRGGESKNSHRDLEDTVRWMLAVVEASGLVANQQTYAKMVHLLLQEGGSDGQHQEQVDTAVEVVLAHMAARGLSLSSHVCTILAEHYFSQRPPDLEAVRALIETGMRRGERMEGSREEGEGEGEEAQMAPRAQRANIPIHRHRLRPPQFDRVFWECVVSGFARVDDTVSAQRYFEHIADSQSVTPSTLESLLRALVRNADWEAAARLVAKVQAQKMLLAQDGETVRARPFRHRFWHLAAEHGLLQQ